MTNALVTGGAGFVGSHLVDRLLAEDYHVTVYDNRSTGRINFLGDAFKSRNFKFTVGDLLDKEHLLEVMSGKDIVFHLAANADIRDGLNDPSRDFAQNTQATHAVLEAMRAKRARRIVFASTGSVYGVPTIVPTPEDCPFPIQTSLYGASKVAGEGLISAYCEGFDFQGLILRFAPMIGERYSHGHLFDFYKKLSDNPDSIEIIGDGKQKKYSLYIHDSLDAIMLALTTQESKIDIYNIGNDNYYTIDESIEWICSELHIPNPIHIYTGKSWAGDNPDMYLDSSKIQTLGWKPKVSLRESVARTIKYLEISRWLVSSRI